MSREQILTHLGRDVVGRAHEVREGLARVVEHAQAKVRGHDQGVGRGRVQEEVLGLRFIVI